MPAQVVPSTFLRVKMFGLIGETLRRLRKERNLTLEELRRAAGLGRGQLSRIENDKQEATLSTLAKILECQGVSRHEFFRRYELVEAEALALARQGSMDGTTETDWPQEIQQVLSKVDSFVRITLDQPRPVAQGAIEIGDWVVLLRVVPKHGGALPEPPIATGGEPPKAPKPKAGAKSSRKRKR